MPSAMSTRMFPVESTVLAIPLRKFRPNKGKCLLLGKVDYDTEWPKLFSNVDPAFKDLDLFKEGLIHLQFKPDEIQEIREPTTD